MPDFLGRILCRLGLHDLELTDVTYSFGCQGGISKFCCRRCGKRKTKIT